MPGRLGQLKKRTEQLYKAMLIATVVLLTACQTTVTPDGSMEQSAQQNSGLTDERRAMINACLSEIGQDPLPDQLSGINAPMNRAEGEAFQACMTRAQGQ
jgi:hypothetical protein